MLAMPNSNEGRLSQFGRRLHGHRADDVGNLALEIAHARLARVAVIQTAVVLERLTWDNPIHG